MSRRRIGAGYGAELWSYNDNDDNKNDNNKDDNYNNNNYNDVNKVLFISIIRGHWRSLEVNIGSPTTAKINVKWPFFDSQPPTE